MTLTNSEREIFHDLVLIINSCEFEIGGQFPIDSVSTGEGYDRSSRIGADPEAQWCSTPYGAIVVFSGSAGDTRALNIRYYPTSAKPGVQIKVSSEGGKAIAEAFVAKAQAKYRNLEFVILGPESELGQPAIQVAKPQY